MRHIVGCAVIAIAACGGRYHTELVGSGGAMVTPRGAEPIAAEPAPGGPPGAAGIQLPAGTYEVSMRFDVPRAQVIEWRLACPGDEVSGTAGETFQQYRTRRLAQLREQRERDRQRVAYVAGAIAGAAPMPRVTGGAQVVAPGARVTVQGEAAVPPEAVGAAVSAAVIDPEVELPPGDVGRGTLGASTNVETTADGACALHAVADDAEVHGTFQVIRVRDLDAEARVRRMAVTSGAAAIRTRVTAQLVAAGADPAARAARLEAEATARLRVAAEAEARATAEAEARLRVRVAYEDRRTAGAQDARGVVIAYLVGKCEADPHRRERAAAAERAERERRLMADAERAARLEADAQHARANVRAYLVALGAKERPPKPPPRPEVAGDPPFPGAEWVAGDWRWEGTEWIWIDGGWSDPVMFDDAGGDVGIGVGIGIGIGIGRDHRGGVRDHRDAPPETVRDHRDGKRDTVTRDHRDGKRDTVIRDHRDGKRDTVVRDHRDGRRSDPPLVMPDSRGGGRGEPVVRDHRDSRESRESRDSKSSNDSRESKSKDKDDDDDRRSSRVRDHRR